MMNLEDVVQCENGLQQDAWSLSEPRFGDNGQLKVVGWSGKSGYNKIYILTCDICRQDYELFGGGFFRSRKSCLLLGKLPCGCSPRTSWTEDQYNIICKRKAVSVGYDFKGFCGEFNGNKTLMVMECHKHGKWSTTSITNFLDCNKGCRACFLERVSENNLKSDADMIATFLSTGRFHPNTEFWRSTRKDSRGYMPFWFMRCPMCLSVGETTSFNLQKGNLSCNCSRSNQMLTYINILYDNGLPIALKFGIATIPENRRNQQSRRCIYEVENHSVYRFQSKFDCLNAERDCKKQLVCGIISKHEMPDGYTETTSISNIEKIVDIFLQNGGSKI